MGQNVGLGDDEGNLVHVILCLHVEKLIFAELIDLH